MSVELSVVTLKGQKLDRLTMSVNDTIHAVKRSISSRMHGQQIQYMTLLYRSKPLQDETRTLNAYGIHAGKKEQLHLVSRFTGGMRSAVNEIVHQLKFVKKAKLFGLVSIDAEDEFTWNMMMKGPKGSPYEEGLFSLTITFPPSYPFSPPGIKFNTPIFHPNVYSDGDLCWAENDQTGSKYFADVFIGAVNALLLSPNPDSPANSTAAHLWTNNRWEYEQRARAHTRENAFAY
ncbi:ubiquitin-conjugating enzyme/RWD-like protein [Dunaliella salina]|uniref:Ubiquitin-conjugating enzyme/RWD-like protein n=1 Tax=Dunaliella salina TaxID=3046 RepID=A0ABQ7G5X1_DUNSA|nr:ubiquitin-conjugating enzyme/RWD-like protein [Dunaliella salina]|eukprot:KAF5830013.1 ubiquitin-conjugating enzyme/RWD-like protein [Dunaliella salina]